jgi:type I restriction enzyme, S subunit
VSVYPQITIDDFCETGSGGTPSRANKDYYGGNIPWVKSGELREDVITDTEEKITERAIKESSAKIVPSGSILLAMYGATVGRMAFLGIDAATNQAVCNIRPDPKRAYPRYVFHCLQSKINHFLSRAAGGAQPNISQGIIKETKIPLPPLDDQRRIATILDKADTLRRKRKRTLELLDSLSQSVFLEMFGDPVSNPKGWPSAKLGSIACKIGSGATPTGGDAAYKSTGITLVRSMNVRDEGFLRKGLAFIDDAQAAKLSNVILEEGDVLLNITGASVARVCLCPADILPARVNQHVSIIRPLEKSLNHFIESALKMPAMKAKLLGAAESGATRQAITKAQIEEIQLPLPPSDLVAKYKSAVEHYVKIQQGTRKFLQANNILCSSLQSRAFSGQL